MPYNPSQPREPKGSPEGGQWTEWGAKLAAKAAREAAGLTLSQEERDAKIAAYEKLRFEGLDFERLIVFDAKTGEPLYEKDGEKTFISFDPSDYRDTQIKNAITGGIISHNHPRVDYPLPHSSADLRSASVMGAIESRVYTTNGVTYIARAGEIKYREGVWNSKRPEWSEGSVGYYRDARILDLWQNTTGSAYDEFSYYAFIENTDIRIDEKVSMFIQATKQTADDFGFTFEAKNHG